MIGEERPGHKYTRRAPDGKGGWVYYYETEDAERAHHYEEHHHPIHRHWQAAEAAQRHPPRTDHYSEEERSDTPRAPRVADPPPPSAAAARVLALVPADLLQDAEGTPEERLAAVAKRAPDVLARIEGLLSAALVAPSDAQDLVYDLLQREGWDASGRAEVIAAALSERGALYVRHRRQLGDAAERLAQGRPVQSAHVAAAADLLALGTASGEGTSREDPGFPDAVSDLGNAAAAELDRLRGLLEAAKRDHSRAAEFVASAAASDALLKLRALSRAFPGTDHDAAAVEETLNAAQALASRTDITDRGSEAALYVAGPDGRPVARRVVYRLAEASDLVPSHDPVSFAPSAAYPEGLQERAYHRDKDEQAKVILNAQSLNPDFLVNTDPTAANGPPVIYPDGVALGGNSRTMAMIRAYRTDPNKGAALRSALMSRASAFGFRPADVKALVNPILVRELEPLPGMIRGCLCASSMRGSRKRSILKRRWSRSRADSTTPRSRRWGKGWMGRSRWALTSRAAGLARSGTT